MSETDTSAARAAEFERWANVFTAHKAFSHPLSCMACSVAGWRQAPVLTSRVAGYGLRTHGGAG